MRVQISVDGYLAIERAGVMKWQFCPHHNETSMCGDWCPLFAEIIDSDTGKTFEVRPCNAEYYHSVVEDLRPGR